MAANVAAGTLGTVVTVTKVTSSAQDNSRQVPITEICLRAQANPFRVCGGHSGTDTTFSSSTSIAPFQCLLTVPPQSFTYHRALAVLLVDACDEVLQSCRLGRDASLYVRLLRF
jgi:hypothetical protein